MLDGYFYQKLYLATGSAETRLFVITFLPAQIAWLHELVDYYNIVYSSSIMISVSLIALAVKVNYESKAIET